jgi:hypothetical protein
MALDLITEADLRFAPPGNPTLGAVFREQGEIQQSYLDSFKSFKIDFDYRYEDASVEIDIAKLREWYKQLDADFEAVLSAMSEDDVQNRVIDRAVWSPSVSLNLIAYYQAVFIFVGKVTVYLKALGKASDQWVSWFG